MLQSILCLSLLLLLTGVPMARDGAEPMGAEPLLGVGSPRFPLPLSFRINQLQSAFNAAVALLTASTAPFVPAIFIAAPTPTSPVAEEYQVKGAFLLNFAKFVSWPDQAFKNPADPISICILGQNPFGPGLQQAARDLTIGDRHVVIRPSSDVQIACQCHIVFVASSERKLTKALLEAAQGESVLTVGESDGFTASGGIIAFKLDGEKVRLEINTAAADRAKLHISAKLLSLAQSAKK